MVKALKQSTSSYIDTAKTYLMDKYTQLKQASHVKNNTLCERCIDCKRCIQCIDCKDCIECTQLTNCEECRYSVAMTDCIACTDCAESNDCYHCSYCSDCENCLLCVSLTGKREGYWMLNEKVSKERFDAAKAMFVKTP